MDLKKIFSRKQSAPTSLEDIAAAIRAAQIILDNLESIRPSLLADLMEAEEIGSPDAIDRAHDGLARLTNRAAAVRAKIDALRQELATALQARQAEQIADLQKNLGDLEAERQKMLSEGVSALAKASYLFARYAGPDERAAIWANLPKQEMTTKLSETSISKYPWRDAFQTAFSEMANENPQAITFWQRRGELMNFETMVFNPMLQGQRIENEAKRLIAGQGDQK